jgi:hypothetical protein
VTEQQDDEVVEAERLEDGDLDRLYEEEDDGDGMGWDGLEDDLEDEP